MYIKIINPKVHGKTVFDNTGSCSRLVNYLDKENDNKQTNEKELFFNADREYVSSNEVIHAIDNNRKGIANGRSRFHSLVIAPDAKELNHIKHDPDKLKEYTTAVMNEYAKNFKFDNGKTLSQDDLVWFAKLEYERNGEYKDGDNMHVHIIVSARDREQKVSMSPNANSKKRFNRVNFALNSEKAFDNAFSYSRQESLLLTHQMKQSKDFNLKVNYFNQLEKNAKEFQKIITHDNYFEKKIAGVFYSPSHTYDQAEEELKRKKRKKKKRSQDRDSHGYSR